MKKKINDFQFNVYNVNNKNLDMNKLILLKYYFIAYLHSLSI